MLLPLYLNLPAAAVIVTQKIRIHNALIDMVKAGAYYTITTDPVTEHQSLGVVVAPSSAHANEISSRSGEDTQYRRSTKDDRLSWIWTVRIRFDQEASSGAAEEAWLADPLTLPLTQYFRGVRCKLTDSIYHHPRRQQGRNGSEIEFTFDVRQTRR